MQEKKPKKFLTPLEQAARMLARQPLSRLELKLKLRKKGIPFQEAEETVRECERLGFINDESAASSAVTMMRDRGDGTRKIQRKLSMRGFSEENIANGMNTDTEQYERDETGVAEKLLNSRLRTLMRETDPFKRRTKALGILAARGFSPDASFAALDRVLGSRSGGLPSEEDI